MLEDILISWGRDGVVVVDELYPSEPTNRQQPLECWYTEQQRDDASGESLDTFDSKLIDCIDMYFNIYNTYMYIYIYLSI